MILDDLAAAARRRTDAKKEETSPQLIKRLAQGLAENEMRVRGKYSFRFEREIKKKGINFICEIKKASPSKGIIAEDFPYMDIAKEYEDAGADCISVLTEPDYFMGADSYLREINDIATIPTLRKDFIIDEYMIYDSKILGASCILLIAALLDTQTLKEYKGLCDELGMSALVEVHDERELESALNAGARMIGVNNRDLKTFTVDVSNSLKLRSLVPQDILFVAESGIKTAADVEALKNAGVNGVLIGETLMRSSNKKAMLDELRGKAE